MTQFEPSLFVRKLVVLRGAQRAYEAEFGLGINVLTGENSSGKSTILAFLIYGLGSDITRWSEHALLCDRVIVEVSINDEVATLLREVSPQPRRPMDIYFGPLDEALGAGPQKWLRFPYQSSESRISFSQQLFGMLALPELQTEVSGKITMHQLMRLHYSDQMSSVEHIFRDEAFDSNDLRDAVGRFVFGAYDNEIYRNRLRIRELKARLDTLNASLRNIYSLLGGTEPLTREWVAAQLAANEVRVAELSEATELLEVQYSEASDELTLGPIREAQSRVVEAQRLVTELDRNIQALEMEYVDSERYLHTMEEKLQAIEDSSEVASEIEQVSYTHCPSCFAELDQTPIDGECHLCHNPFDEERLRGRLLRQVASIRRQLKQSRALQSARRKDLELAGKQREELLEKWNAAKVELEAVRAKPSSSMQHRIRQKYESIGRLRQEREDLQGKLKLVGKLDQMSAEKQDVMSEMATLEDMNRRLEESEQERLAKGTALVAEEAVWFLKNDLQRQDTFEAASSIAFSFLRDKISVNGIEYFSASSKVYLKNAFLSGLLFASLRLAEFRHLRLLILDTIEDKGMEPERSQNFQKLLADRSDKSEVEHQIIFATSMIADTLDTDAYIVGRRSTHDSRTLRIA